ncbi:hypothetical protein GGD50_005232 [Rhizobium paranaense]|uniref:Uncharacterized protein n=1 Tax=Rhizobium paranaense TaxID=1650438 RepID=A0A7W9D3P2_9HYPH|nr:hypothetical protein [Rhizobium paranaense]
MKFTFIAGAAARFKNQSQIRENEHAYRMLKEA